MTTLLLLEGGVRRGRAERVEAADRSSRCQRCTVRRRGTCLSQCQSTLDNVGGIAREARWRIGARSQARQWLVWIGAVAWWRPAGGGGVIGRLIPGLFSCCRGGCWRRDHLNDRGAHYGERPAHPNSNKTVPENPRPSLDVLFSGWLLRRLFRGGWASCDCAFSLVGMTRLTSERDKAGLASHNGVAYRVHRSGTIAWRPAP